MAMKHEQAALIMLIEALYRRGEDWERREQPRRPEKLKNAAFAVLAQLTRQDVEGYRAAKAEGSFGEDRIILLQPPSQDREAIATLWCRWNFESAVANCGFYYGVWSMVSPLPGTKVEGDGKRVPAFIGYRFETPEIGTNHNYYHSQPCRSMGSKVQEIVNALQVSSKMPTWPLAAANEVELLLCMILSLYGFIGFRQIRDAVLNDRRAQRNPALTDALAKVGRLEILH